MKWYENDEEEEQEEGEEQIDYAETLRQCWTSPFMQSSNTMFDTCGQVCDKLEAQTCGLEMLSDSEYTPNGLGAYGVGCFDQSCTEDEAGKMKMKMLPTDSTSLKSPSTRGSATEKQERAP